MSEQQFESGAADEQVGQGQGQDDGAAEGAAADDQAGTTGNDGDAAEGDEVPQTTTPDAPDQDASAAAAA